MYNLEECAFVVEWTGIATSAVSRVSFKSEWEIREENHNEVKVKTTEHANQFFELIPANFKPRLWLEATDGTRLLVRSRIDNASQ